MEKSRKLQAEEALGREPYFVRDDTEDSNEPAPAIHGETAIECCHDWVIIDRDRKETTIATVEGYGELPTGTVVGTAPGSKLQFGDRVYFAATMVTQKVQHPAYDPDRNLIVLQERNIFFKI